MPQRNGVLQLPSDVRAQLDHRLVASGFSGYDDLAAWLRDNGFEISKSAIHRYGQSFEQKMAALKIATEQARVIAEATGDDEGRLGEALTSLVQQKAFEVLVDMEDAGELDLVSLGTMVARLNKTGVDQKKHILSVRDRAAKAASEVETIAKREGLSDDAAALIRAKILGIAA